MNLSFLFPAGPHLPEIATTPSIFHFSFFILYFIFFIFSSPPPYPLSSMNITEKLDLLAPFEIWEVQLGKSTIKFHKPLVLTPEWLPDDPDEPDENEYLAVEYPFLDISAFGRDREELWRCIRGDIRAAWQHCVRIPIDKLSPINQKIRENYLSVAEEVADE